MQQQPRGVCPVPLAAAGIGPDVVGSPVMPSGGEGAGEASRVFAVSGQRARPPVIKNPAQSSPLPPRLCEVSGLSSHEKWMLPTNPKLPLQWSSHQKNIAWHPYARIRVLCVGMDITCCVLRREN